MSLREQIIHGLRMAGWSRIEAETEADEQMARPAIATEAASAAETPKSGSVHEGAGRNGIAQTPPQPQSESNQ